MQTESGAPAQFTCVVQPAQAIPRECSKDNSTDVLGSVLGMGWAFATLLIVVLLLLFGPKGKMGELLGSIAAFFGRVTNAKVGDFSLSTEASEALRESPHERVAGAVSVVEAAEQEVAAVAKGVKELDPDTELVEKLLKKDFSGVTVGDYPYLMHEGSHAPQERFPYTARVYLEFWDEQEIQRAHVEKVFYRVDDSFPKKWWVMSGEDARRGFQLVVRVVGEFTIVAVVKLKSGQYIWLTRYLDLPGRPTA